MKKCVLEGGGLLQLFSQETVVDLGRAFEGWRHAYRLGSLACAKPLDAPGMLGVECRRLEARMRFTIDVQLRLAIERGIRRRGQGRAVREAAEKLKAQVHG